MTTKPAAKSSKAAKPAAPITPPPADPNAGRMAVIQRAAPPAAPASTFTVTTLTDVAVNLMHLLAVSPEPVSGATLSPAVAYSLKSLAGKGIAELAPNAGGTDKRYVLTEHGRALVTLLWPDAKAAPAKTTGKAAPAAKAPAKAAKPAKAEPPVKVEPAKPTVSAAMTAMLRAVREHAQAHYEQGWDIIVEATTDDELAELIGKARTNRGAIANVESFVDLKAEQQRGIDAQVDG